MIKRATGAEDPALGETTWPLPLDPVSDIDSPEWKLRYAPTRLTTLDALAIAEILHAYRALIVDGQTKQQLARLAALRRVYRKRP